MFSLFEELFILALDEKKGNIFPFAKRTLAHGLAGGILAELTLLDKVRSNEKSRLEVLDPALTGDEVLDEAIGEIQASEKPRKLAYWVSQLSVRPKKLRERMGKRLAAKGVLYQEDKRFFWKLPESGEEVPVIPSKFDLKIPLRASILSSEESDPRTLALLNIASASNLLNLIFTQDEIAIAQQRIQERVLGAALEKPAMQTIEEIEGAIISSLEDDSD